LEVSKDTRAISVQWEVVCGVDGWGMLLLFVLFSLSSPLSLSLSLLERETRKKVGDRVGKEQGWDLTKKVEDGRGTWV